MKLADLLEPQEPIPCPHCIERGLHGNMLNTDLDQQRGYCLFCAMIPPHKADSGFKLNTDIRAHYPLAARVTYRSEPNCYGQDGAINDD